MSIGERLREERERMGLSQPKFAALASTTKQTLFSWESGKTAPDGFQLSVLAESGVDIQYVLTGHREVGVPVDAAEQALLESYRRCGSDAKINLIQTAALLSAGLSDQNKKPKKTKMERNSSITQRDNNGMQITGDNNVQIGGKRK